MNVMILFTDFRPSVGEIQLISLVLNIHDRIVIEKRIVLFQIYNYNYYVLQKANIYHRKNTRCDINRIQNGIENC